MPTREATADDFAHPSFRTNVWMAADLARGERYFILEDNGAAPGCVAYGRPRADVAYLIRLPVLPAQRKQGHGERWSASSPNWRA